MALVSFAAKMTFSDVTYHDLLYNNNIQLCSSQELRVEVHSKLLISQSKFSGPRKFTLRYQ